MDDTEEAHVPEESSSIFQEIVTSADARTTFSIVNIRSLQQEERGFSPENPRLQIDESQGCASGDNLFNVEEPKSDDDVFESSEEDVKAKKCCEFLVSWAQKNREVITMEQYSQLLSVKDSINLKMKDL